MNLFQGLNIANQIVAISANAPKGLTGDTLLYWASRKLAERLEIRNSNIASNAGFPSAITDRLY